MVQSRTLGPKVSPMFTVSDQRTQANEIDRVYGESVTLGCVDANSASTDDLLCVFECLVG